MDNHLQEEIIKLVELNMGDGDISLNLFNNRNVFQEELMKITEFFLKNEAMPMERVYIVSAIIGEIGNNSFDHNLGNWISERGVIFGYKIDDEYITVVIADGGQGLLKTLKTVKNDLDNDKDAIKVAFTEIISGRAPEARGNGLKFVKENVIGNDMRLIFISGNAKAILNGGIKIEDNQSDRYQGCLAILKIKR